MENATKALLIAAAVLAAILVIGLAIMIVNMGDQSDNAANVLNSMDAQAFNSKYEMYEGVCSGSRVQKVLTNVINDNAQLFGKEVKDNKNMAYSINIRSTAPDILNKFKGNSAMTTGLNGTRSYGVRYPENIVKIKQAVSPNKKYKLWFSYNKKTGYIWEVHIDEP